MASTSILIPCWNALDMTRVCLEQILLKTPPPYELIVVDDGSTDGTWRWLSLWRSRRVSRGFRGIRLLRNRRNRGYPAAINRAIRASTGELLVLGNSDAAPSSGWLEQMSALFAEKPRLGGLSPMTNLPRPKGLAAAPWSAPPAYADIGGMDRFLSACRLRFRRRPFIAARDMIPGFWFMTRRSALDRTGFFDETFAPNYCEDWDLQHRLREAGFELGFAANAYVHHEDGGIRKRNEVDVDDLFRKGLRRLAAKYPRRRRWLMEVGLPSGGEAVFARTFRRPSPR